MTSAQREQANISSSIGKMRSDLMAEGVHPVPVSPPKPVVTKPIEAVVEPKPAVGARGLAGPVVVSERSIGLAPSPTKSPVAPVAPVAPAAQQAAFEYEASRMAAEDAYSGVRETKDAEEDAVLEAQVGAAAKEATDQKLKDMEEEMRQRDYQDLANPNLVSVKVLFPGEDIRTVYRFHLPKEDATLTDLRLLIGREFGYAYAQQHFYFNFRLLPDTQVLTALPDIDTAVAGAEIVLRFLPDGPPEDPPAHIVRPLIHEYSLDELKTRILKGDGEDLLAAPSATETETPDGYPLFRDWVQQQSDISYGLATQSLKPEDAEKQLTQLSNEFNAVAAKGVELIVDGKLRPVELFELYGAGGEKFVVGGVVFRKVGGWICDGQNLGEGDIAFKMAGHDQRAADRLRDQVKDLQVPLSCIIDFCGQRFHCIAQTSLSATSIAHGSATDGLSICKSERDVLEVARAAGEFLNVAEHTVRPSLRGERKREETCALGLRTQIFSSADGQQFIIFNAAGALPSDVTDDKAPGKKEDKDDDTEVMKKVKLLRPELVRNFGAGSKTIDGYEFYTSQQPVMCDVCSKIVLEHTYYAYEKREYDVCINCYNNLEKDQFAVPFDKLKRKVVPPKERLRYWKNKEGDVQLERPVHLTPLNSDGEAFPRTREELSELTLGVCLTETALLRNASSYLHETIIPEFVDEINELRWVPNTGDELVAAMHERGINVRYIGTIAQQVNLSPIREICVREMIARTVKVLIRDGLSFMETPSMDDAKAIVCHYINEVFTTDERESSNTMWQFVSDLCEKKFNFAVDRSIRDKVYLLGLLRSICKHCGVKLLKFKGFDFSDPYPVVVEDIEYAGPQIKAAAFEGAHEVERAIEQAESMDEDGKRSKWYLPGGAERAKATTLYRESVALATHVYGKDHPKTGDAMYSLGMHLESRFQEAGRPEFSRWNRSAGIEPTALSKEAQGMFQQALMIRETLYGDLSLKVADCYRALARLAQTSEPAVAVDYLSKAVEITETVCGFQHHMTAQLYTDIALFYLELHRIELASPSIRKAFVANYLIFGQDSPVTLRSYQLVQQIETNMDSGLAEVPIDMMAERIETLAFEAMDEDAEDDTDSL